MTDNNAAERLRAFLNGRFVPGHPENHADWLDAALAAERRATVERIRAALKVASPVPLKQALRHQESGPEWDDLYWRADIDAILDAEAER